jgi:hypothetical protein
MSTLFSKSIRFGFTIVMLASIVPVGQAFAQSTPRPTGAANATPPGTMAAVNKSTPAFDAFRKAWEAMSNYTEVITAHETTNDGKSSEDRTYDYTFVKPNAVLIAITSGPGRGGGAAWNGGPTVRGHQGGFFSRIKLTIPKNDPRATSLRGDQIDVASFGYEIDRFASIAGTLTESTDGTGNIVITFVPSAADASGITREMLTLSPANNLPIKHEAFVGTTRVKIETFSNIKLNVPNLAAKDIARV